MVAGDAYRWRWLHGFELDGEVLAVEPNDADLHRRIAPLLADVKQPDDAWASYSRAVEVMPAWYAAAGKVPFSSAARASVSFRVGE